MMTIDEAIKHCEEVAEEQDKLATRYEDASGYSRSHIESLKTNESIKCRECANEHRQLAKWLRELKESRIVLDILGQFLVDLHLDGCCEDLIMKDDYCEKYCDNQKPLCWYKWAKMKAREVNADDES